MTIPSLQYISEPQQSSLFFTTELNDIIAKMSSALGDKTLINIYPDATFKGWGLPNGIATIAKQEDAILLPTLLRDVGCGFLLFKIDLNSHPKDWQQKIGTIIVNLLGQKINLDLATVNNILFAGPTALANITNIKSDLTKFYHQKFKVSTNIQLSKQELELLRNELGIVTNTIELKAILSIVNNKPLVDCGINERSIIGFIHTGTEVFGKMLADKFLLKIIKFADGNGLFSLEDIKQAIFGVPINTALGSEYYEWLKMAMNYTLANRYLVFHQLKEQLETAFPCKISIINDVVHCGVLEEFYHQEKMVKTFRGIQSIYDSDDNIQDTNKSLRLLAGQRETISALVIGSTNSDQYFNFFSHGISSNILDGYDYRQHFSNKEITNYMEIAREVFYNTTPNYEHCLPYTYNLISSLEYFDKIKLTESLAILKPLVNIQSTIMQNK